MIDTSKPFPKICDQLISSVSQENVTVDCLTSVNVVNKCIIIEQRTMSNRFWNIIFPILLIIAANDLRKAILNFWDAAPTVTISLGKIRGKYVRIDSGESLYSFRGIRYAQAPINELRFAVRSIKIHFKFKSATNKIKYWLIWNL